MPPKLSRRRKYVIAAVLLSVVLAEVYAQTYVEVNGLDVVAEGNAKAQRSSPGGIIKFIQGNCEWVFAYAIERPQNNRHNGYIWVYIYKVAENKSALASTTGIVVSDVKLSPVDDVYLSYDPKENLYYSNNCTYVRLDFDFMGNGSYPIDLNFDLRFYQRSIIGVIPVGEMNMPVNATVVAWKDN